MLRRSTTRGRRACKQGVSGSSPLSGLALTLGKVPVRAFERFEIVGTLWALGSSLGNHLGRVHLQIRVQIEDYVGVGCVRHCRRMAEPLSDLHVVAFM
jgi:hypothetical protein